MQEETEEQVLERVNEERQELELKLTIQGVYSLPQEWKEKLVEDPEAVYNYEVSLLGSNALGGKLIPRELTESEKEEAEAAKTKGKAPPPKGKKGEDEELSPEEQERLEQERLEKEEEERKKQEEWDALDEDTKFYRTNEDIFKEPAVKFQIEVPNEEPEEGENDQPQEENPDEAKDEGEGEIPKTHLEDVCVTQIKKSHELIEFEECVKDELGWWIFFSKLLPKEDEADDPKKKGKGKGAPSEEEKPNYGRAWIDLSLLRDPGETKVETRVYLETTEFKKEPAEDEEAEAAPDANPDEEQKEELKKVFEEAKTYIKLIFEISEPITPTEDKFVVQAVPHDLIELKSVTKSKIKPVRDPDGDFRKQLTLAIESINKEYLNMFGEDIKREGIGGCSDETFEARKEQFLYDFNTSGKYHIMKEKLKKTIVKIVRDTFKKRKSFKGLHMDDKDHFYSILYAHLVNQIQHSIKDMADTRKDELHENILISNEETAQKEVDVLINTHTNESADERLARLAEEYEEQGDLDKALSYIEQRIKINPDSIDLWRSYSLFMIRNFGNMDKARECLREAITLWEENDDELFLVYGALLVQMQEKKQALIFLTKVGKEEEQPDLYIKAHLLMSIMYSTLDEQELKDKHFSYAVRMKLRQKGNIIAKKSLKDSAPPPETSENPRALPTLEETEVDELYFDLIESLLIPEGITNLANDILELVSDQDSPNIIKIKAKIQYGERKYEEVLETIEEYLDEHKFDVEAITIMANTYFALEKYDDSEKTYLRAIRRGADDPVIKKRLGLIYIRLKKWKEAQTVFDQYCNHLDAKCAYAWRYLGMSTWKLRDIDGAEKSFNISNLLDNTNPETWGLLTIICLIIGVGQNRAFQSYQKSIKLGLNNYEIFAELGYLFTKAKDLDDTAAFCYERALEIEQQDEDVWIQYGDFVKERGDIKKSIYWYENALKQIKGEVKHREVTLTLKTTQDKFDTINKSIFKNLVNESDGSNQIAAK